MPYKKNTTSIADLGGFDDLDLTCPNNDDPPEPNTRQLRPQPLARQHVDVILGVGRQRRSDRGADVIQRILEFDARVAVAITTIASGIVVVVVATLEDIDHSRPI